MWYMLDAITAITKWAIIAMTDTYPLVSFPDPFCARARNLKLGGGGRPGKGSGKSSRPSTATGM